jgi:hypothetical protein
VTARYVAPYRSADANVHGPLMRQPVMPSHTSRKWTACAVCYFAFGRCQLGRTCGESDRRTRATLRHALRLLAIACKGQGAERRTTGSTLDRSMLPPLAWVRTVQTRWNFRARVVVPVPDQCGCTPEAMGMTGAGGNRTTWVGEEATGSDSARILMGPPQLHRNERKQQ